MKCKKTRLGVLAAFSAFAFAPFASADFEKYLPEDDTLSVLKIENLATLKRRAAQDAFFSEFKAKILSPRASGGAGTLDAWTKFFASAGLCGDAGTPASWAKFCAAAGFSGEIAVAQVSASSVGGNAKDSETVFIAECASDFTADKADALFAEIFSENNAAAPFPRGEDVSPAGVPAKKRDGGVFGVSGGKFVFSTNEPLFEKIVAAVSDGNASGGLADSAVFKAARERVGNADVWFYADGAAFAKNAYASAAESDKAQAKQFEKNPEAAMFFVSSASIVKALAPEAINSLWAKIEFGGDGRDGAAFESALSWREDRGLVSVLTASMKDGVEKPALFPPNADARLLCAANFSVGAMILKTAELARRASPLFGILEMQLQSMKTARGADFYAALGALDCGFFMRSVLAGTERGTVVALNVSDEKLAVEAIRGAGEIFSESKCRRLAGTPANVPAVYAFGEGDDVCAFSCIGGKLCVGRAAAVLALAENSARGNAASQSAWDAAPLRAGEARLPEGGCGVFAAHIGKMLELISEAAEKAFPHSRIFENFRADAFGGLDYSVVAKSYLRGTEFSVRGVIVENK